MTELVLGSRREEGRRVLDLCTDLGTPAQVRPPGKLILRGKKLLMKASHNVLWAQFRLRCCRRKEAQGKTSDLREKPGGNEK